MAEKRMFSKTIIDSDLFLDMPMSSQCLYFHLCMRADDDGFVNNPKKISRLIGASEDDLRLLLAKNFVLGFASGVIVIKHWRLHNWFRSDTYKPTIYTDEKSMIEMDENKMYQYCNEPVAELLQNCNTDKISIDKNRLDKISKDNNTISVAPNLESSSPAITLLTNKTDVEFPVTQEFIEQMQDCYPAVDVYGELMSMKAWLISNPKNRKTYNGMTRFINSWLSRQQNRSHGSVKKDTIDWESALKWAEEEDRKRELEGNDATDQ